MVNISYQLGCRHCFRTDGVPSVYFLADGDPALFRKKPEYEVVRLIENWQKQDKRKCQFCTSQNLEILEVKINDKELYNFDRLSSICRSQYRNMFNLNIDKKGDKISVGHGTSPFMDNAVLLSMLSKFSSLVDSVDSSSFEEHETGNVFMFAMGDPEFNNDPELIVVHKFKYHGITKEDIKKVLDPKHWSAG